MRKFVKWGLCVSLFSVLYIYSYFLYMLGKNKLSFRRIDLILLFLYLLVLLYITWIKSKSSLIQSSDIKHLLILNALPVLMVLLITLFYVITNIDDIDFNRFKELSPSFLIVCNIFIYGYDLSINKRK